MVVRIALQDGRKVEIEEYGDPQGQPALWFHGGFSSRLEPSFLDAPCKELGVRLLSLDRPGVGGSDPLRNRTLIGYADDVRQVLDSQEIDQAAVGGLSNGGMYTMAVASQLPDRVLRAVPNNSSAPIADAHARAALGWKARLSYRLTVRRVDRLDDMMTKAHGPIARRLASLANPDAQLYDQPDVAVAHAATLREAVRQPSNGNLQIEVRHLSQPWGFDHRAITVPVAIVSGARDAGLGYARAWAQELPQGRLVVVPGGHLAMPDPRVSRRLVELLAGVDSLRPIGTGGRG